MNHSVVSDFITISMKDILATTLDVDHGLTIPLSRQDIWSLDEQSRPAIIRVWVGHA
jgi:hypothetical protein